MADQEKAIKIVPLPEKESPIKEGDSKKGGVNPPPPDPRPEVKPSPQNPPQKPRSKE